MIVEHAATDSKELITAANKVTVYWVTGLPGAGKTSIAGQFFQWNQDRAFRFADSLSNSDPRVAPYVASALEMTAMLAPIPRILSLDLLRCR